METKWLIITALLVLFYLDNISKFLDPLIKKLDEEYQGNSFWGEIMYGFKEIIISPGYWLYILGSIVISSLFTVIEAGLIYGAYYCLMKGT